MKKKMKKVALLMAAVMCLTMMSQSVMPAKAATASTYAWKCATCSNTLTVEVKPIKVGYVDKGICNEHKPQGAECHIICDIFQDEYWITCSPCGVSERNGISERYEGAEKHIVIF